MLGGDSEDRAQLRAQQLGLLEPEPDTAHAEERVVLGRLAQDAQRLVGAGVERADDQRPAVERGGDLGVDRALLLLGRAPCRGRGTGTPCAAARRLRRRARPPRPPRPRCPGWRRPRASSPSVVVAGSRRARSGPPRGGARPPRRARSRSAITSGGRLDLDGPGPAVEHERRAVRQSQHRLAEPDDGRDRRARGRGSRRATVAPPRATASPWTSERSSAAASPGVMSRATRMPGSAMPAWRGHPGQVTQHAPGHVVDVGGALAQVRRRRARGRPPRPPRGSAPRAGGAAPVLDRRREPGRGAPRRRAGADARRRSPPRPRRRARPSGPARPRRRRAPPCERRRAAPARPPGRPPEPRRRATGPRRSWEPHGADGDARATPARRAAWRRRRADAGLPRTGRGLGGRGGRSGGSVLVAEVRRPPARAARRARRRRRDRWRGPRSCAPDARPSVTTAVRLRASAGPRPVVSSRICTEASNRPAVSTTRAAGRACRPSALGTSMRTLRRIGQSTRPGGRARRARSPSRPAFMPSAERASSAASSSPAPAPARAAAATAPSTERRLAEQDLGTVFHRDQLDRHLGAHAPRCRGPSARARRRPTRPASIAARTELDVRADRARRVGHPARGLDRHVGAAHLARELDHARRPAPRCERR